jgi:ABC-type transporter Mla MlaB component
VLRISSQTQDGRSVLRFEGRLAGVWVHEAEIHWSAARRLATDAHLEVDLRDVVSIDAAGRHLLLQMQRDGASFVVAGCAMRALIADLSAIDSQFGEPDGLSAADAVGRDVSGEE